MSIPAWIGAHRGAAAAACVAVLGLLVAAVVVTSRGPSPGSGASATQGQNAPPTTRRAAEPTHTTDGTDVRAGTPTGTAPADAEAAALTELARQHDADRSLVSFDGRYAAQLASKAVGIVDPFQTAANGSHTFYAADILFEHRQLRAAGASTTGATVLILSTDFGARSTYNGQQLWMTFQLGPFAGPDAVKAWCAGRFPQFSGEALTNRCLPRRLDPPRS